MNAISCEADRDGSLKINSLQRKARIVAQFHAAGATQDEILYAAMH